LLLAVALFVAAASTATAQEASAKISGTAAYRERIALLPGAVFEATLEDVSRADAQATVLGTARVENVGAVPIRFEIPYDPKVIDSGRSYAVRGRIVVNGKVGFTTDTVYPVLTRGAGNSVELLLVRARGAQGGAPAEASASAAAPAPQAAQVESDRDPIGDLNADAIKKGDFPGSFLIPGPGGVSFGIGGFVKSLVFHDSKAEGREAVFLPVLLGGIGRDDEDGTTSLTAELSRVNFDARASVGESKVRGYVEFDFSGDLFKFRHGYCRGPAPGARCSRARRGPR
jgi:putative lipoprotein